MKYKNISFVVGRFQPFHNGHRHLIDTAMANSGFDGLTIIFIGSSTNVECEKNPFNFYKRVDMISKTYGRQHNMIICPLPDFETDEAWVDHIRQVVYDLSYDDSIITAVVNDKDEDTTTSNSLFEQIEGCNIKRITGVHNISGTEIRKLINDGVEIKDIDDLPYGTRSVLQEYC